MIQLTYSQGLVHGRIRKIKLNQHAPNIKRRSELTADDYRNARKQLKDFVISRLGSSYMARGCGSRWTRVNTNKSTVLTNGGVIMDISKWDTARNITSHVSIMHKIAHRIKVNAFKLTRQVGDKQV